MAINKAYSYGDFTGMTFTGRSPAEFLDSEIVGSCFAQEAPWSDKQADPLVDVFPAGTTGVTFTRCNLDNVRIPAGCTLDHCTNKRIRVQNDLHDWVVDKDGQPVEPVSPKLFDKLSLSKDPKDIPAVKLLEPAGTAEVA